MDQPTLIGFGFGFDTDYCYYLKFHFGGEMFLKLYVERERSLVETKLAETLPLSLSRSLSL